MQSKRKVNAKKIQRGGGGSCFVLISKETMDELKLRAQDPNILMLEVPNPTKDELIFKVVRLGV